MITVMSELKVVGPTWDFSALHAELGLGDNCGALAAVTSVDEAGVECWVWVWVEFDWARVSFFFSSSSGRHSRAARVK